VTKQVRVEVQNGAHGAHLADGSGKSLYMFASDTATNSKCNSACASYWPPLIASGAARAVGAVKAADLGTVTRSDGRTQVTYAGHPLYYYIGDTKAGDVNGQGLDDFGAYWWLLTPTGKSLTGTASGGSGSSGGASNGGGGW
jgi:predicted lipoprotein with Yx(FWY)xxD motif